jgi:hypothetical protein
MGAYGPRKYQAGGEMPAPEAGMAPAGPGPEAGGGGGDLEAMLMEYAQTRDPQLAVAIADALVEMLAAQAGGGAGAPAGPEAGGAPPMARRGAKLTTRGPVFRK